MKTKSLLLAAGLPLLVVTSPAQTVLVPWNQQWSYMHPMGTQPADADFNTTWYLKDADFAVQYNGPTFGASPRQSGVPGTAANDTYDSGIAPGPIGYEVIDYFAAAGAELTAFGKLASDADPAVNNPDSVLSIPVSGARRAAYFRTTFEVTGTDALVKPSIRMLMDDGCYIYVDGVLTAAVNLPVTGNDVYATVNAVNATNTETQLVTLDLSAAPNPAANTRVINQLLSLEPGTHTLAISARSNSQTSSDMVMGLELSARVGGIISALASNVVRDEAGTPDVPGDDTFSFQAVVSQRNIPGGSWNADTAATNTTTSGTYDSVVSYGPFPVASAKTIVFTDSGDNSVTTSLTVSTPPYVHKVTATNSPKITFTPSTPGDASYTPPAATGGTEPGWTGGTAGANTNSNVQLQPAPSPQNLKYFHFTTNGVTFMSDVVGLNAIKGSALEVEMEVAFYSTSTSGLDAGDELNFRLEIAQDGDFSNTAGGNIILANIQDLPAGTATAFGTSVAVADDYINLGVAGGPAFPTADFRFHKFSGLAVVPVAATNPRARFVGQTITGISTTEHVLLDNITFRRNTTPALIANAGTATWNNNGTVSAADDTFSAPVTISPLNLGASIGWRSNENPARTGLYAVPGPVTFGPYPGRTPFGLQLSDQLAPAVQSGMINIAPPATAFAAVLAATPNIIRDEKAAGFEADAVSFDLTVSGSNGGPQFALAGEPGVATTTSYALSAAGSTVTVTVSPVPSQGGTIYVRVYDASYPAFSANIAVAVPAPTALPGEYVLGSRDFGFGASPVLSLAGDPLPPALQNFPGIPALAMHNGALATVKSEVIDLTTVGNVLFTARLRAIDTSSGFEDADTFSARLILDGDPLNFILTTDASDTDTPKDGLEGLELAIAGGSLGVPVLGTHNLSARVPESATTVQLEVTAVTNSPNEQLILDNVLFALAPATGDTDGDGVSDADEAIMGTSPTDASDVLRLSQNPADPTQLSFPTKAGRYYRIYTSDDDAEATHLQVWKDSALATIEGDGNAASFSITVAPGEARRFYRLHVMETDGAWPAVVPAS